MQDNYNKLKLEADSSKSGIESGISDLLKNLESLGKEVETMKVALQTTDDKISSLEEKSQNLNAELTNLKQTHQKLEQEVENKETELNVLNQKLQDQQHLKNTMETEISNREKQLSELQKAVSSLESTIADTKQRLLNAENLREERVGVIEKEVAEYQDNIERKTNQYKILKHFLETDYVSDSHFDVIKVLKQPGVDTIDRLTMISAVGRGTVDETLKELAAKGVISLEGNKFSIAKDFIV